MGDPEFPHRRVGMRERETVRRERMAEASRVEINAPLFSGGPIHPRRKIVHRQRVAVRYGIAVGGVTGVQIQPQWTGTERRGHFQIRAQLFRRAGLAGIITGGQTAVARASFGALFKATHIIALPAVQRDGNLIQLTQIGLLGGRFCLHVQV